MKKVKLTKIKISSLSEIFQSLDIKFSWVNKNFEQVSTPAKCRDFLGDCLWSKKKGKVASIYGFFYDYKKTPFDDCRLSLTFPDNNSKDNFLKNISYLHQREKQAGVKLSRVFETQDKSTLIIEGSNCWITSAWKISLYTFYLKVISYEDISKVKDPESVYIKSLSKEREDTLLSKVRHSRFEHTPDSISDAHNYMGFLSVIRGSDYCSETVLNHKLIFGV